MRLFLAIDPGVDCRRKVSAVIDEARTITTSVRWVHEDKLHVTLAFCGEVTEDRAATLADAAIPVIASHAPFGAVVAGGGAFPDWRRPGVIWLGLADPGQVQRLGEEVSTLCARHGFPPDHPFRAHLTIGRVQSRLNATEREALRNTLQAAGPHPFEVTRVVLMQSVLGRAGSVYSELASFPLGGT